MDKSVGGVYISPIHLVWSVLPVNLNIPGLNKSIQLNNIEVNPKPRILKQAKKKKTISERNMTLKAGSSRKLS